MVIKLNYQGVPEGDPISDPNFRALFTNLQIGAAITPEITEPLGYGMYAYTVPPVLTSEQRYKKLVELSPVKNLETGYWMQTWEITDQNPQEIIKTDDVQKKKIRDQRKARLVESDWTDLPNTPMSSEKKTEWIGYRQSLRDIPSQQGFPWDVIWPNTPS